MVEIRFVLVFEGAMSPIFCINLKSQSHVRNDGTQNNGLFMFKTTLLVHLNCKYVLLATNGQDGNGLQLEKNRAPFSSFPCCLAKTIRN